MLDARYFAENVAELEKALKRRNADTSLVEQVTTLSKRRRELIQETEGLKAQRNAASQEIAQLKAKSKTDPAAAALADEKVKAMRAVGDRIKALDDELRAIEEKFQGLALGIPNIPDTSVPDGESAEQNVEVRRWGTPRKFDFQPKDHVDLGEGLGILDFERAGKISGARFSLSLGAAASLERALIQFMLDLHTRQHGYRETIPPFLVSRTAMTGTGQLPKFEEDAFKTGMADRELFLIPTSEVPLTNIYRDEILPPGMLPAYFTAYSPCFRSEAGSYGKDTRGLIRQHQFQKWNSSKSLSHPLHLMSLRRWWLTPRKCFSFSSFLIERCFYVLGTWGLRRPKRMILRFGCRLRTAIVRFPRARTVEISKHVELESVRADAQGKPQLAHTLNGSGLAVGRTFVAILENFKKPTAAARIPKVLNRYLEGAPGFEQDASGQLWMRKPAAK